VVSPTLNVVGVTAEKIRRVTNSWNGKMFYTKFYMRSKRMMPCYATVVIVIEKIHKRILDVGGKLFPLGHGTMTSSINCAATSCIALLSSGDYGRNSRCRLIRYAVQIGDGCIC